MLDQASQGMCIRKIRRHKAGQREDDVIAIGRCVCVHGDGRTQAPARLWYAREARIFEETWRLQSKRKSNVRLDYYEMLQDSNNVQKSCDGCCWSCLDGKERERDCE